MARRITIVTAGHLATCPRMVKAADALHARGHHVRVVSVQHTAWARAGDRALRATRSWRWDPIECGRREAPVRWLVNGVRSRAATAVAHAGGAGVPYAVAVRAFSRVHDRLVAAILREPTDLVYGGTTGALAAVAEAARRSGTPFGVDFEDLHYGEHPADDEGRLQNALADAVMRDVLRDATFATAGSAAIARACGERFGRTPVAVHNVFRLPKEGPANRGPERPLRFYWVSQTIGPGRGLEDLVGAAARLAVPCELNVRGMSANGYVDRLRADAAARAPSLRVNLFDPDPPDAMIDGCRAFDVGLAVETGRTPNSALSLSNKALTYPLAGLPVVLSDTPGQRALRADLGEGAVSYEPGDAAGLATALRAWLADPRALARAREASWEAARRRWHWDHAEECGALTASVEQALP